MMAFPHDDKENMPPETPPLKGGMGRKFGTDLSRTAVANQHQEHQYQTTPSTVSFGTKKVRVKSSAKKKLRVPQLVPVGQEHEATPLVQVAASAATTTKAIKQQQHQHQHQHQHHQKQQKKPTHLSIETTTNATTSTTSTNNINTNNINTNNINTNNNNNNSNSNNNNSNTVDEYTITFQPGPIGMKLEPVVVQTGGIEVGCRVLKFVDTSISSPSQARAGNKIQLGDLLIAVNHTDVVSWSYPDVIRFLKMLPTTQSKRLTFRTILTKPTPNRPASNRNWNRNRIATTTATASATTTATTIATATPKDASSFQPFPHKEKVSTNHVLNRWYGSPILSPPPTASSFASSSAFSPSKVKELSSTSTSTSILAAAAAAAAALDRTLEDSTDDTMTTVSTHNNNHHLSRMAATTRAFKRIVAPAAYQMATSVSSQFHSVARSSTSDFHQQAAVSLKMQLLTELSHAKITLDAKAQEKESMDSMIRNLTNQVDLGRHERNGLACEVQRWKDDKTKVELFFQDLITKQDAATKQQQQQRQSEAQQEKQDAVLEQQRNAIETEQQRLQQQQIMMKLSTQLEQTKATTQKERLEQQQRFESEQRRQYEAQQEKHDAILGQQRSTFEAEQHRLQQQMMMKLSTQLEHTKATTQKERLEQQQRFESERQNLVTRITELQAAYARDKATLQEESNAKLNELMQQHAHQQRQEIEARSEADAVLQKAQQTKLDNLMASHEAAIKDERDDKDTMLAESDGQSKQAKTELRQAQVAMELLIKTKNDLKGALQSTLHQAESSMKHGQQLEETLENEQEKRATAESHLQLAQTRSETQQAAMAQLQQKLSTQMDASVQDKKHLQETLLAQEDQQRQQFNAALMVARQECADQQAAMATATVLGEAQRDDWESQLKTVQHELAEQQIAMKVEQKRLEDANETNVTRLENEVVVTKEHIRDVQSKLEIAEEQCSQQVAKMVSMKADMERRNETAAKESKRLAQVEAELEAAQSQSSDQTTSRSTMESERIIMTSELSSTKQSLYVAQADLAIMSDDLDSAETERDAVLSRVDVLKVEVSGMQLETQELHRLVDRLREDCTDKDQELQQLNATTEQLRERETILASKVEELEMTKERLRNDNQALESECSKKIEEVVDAVQKQFELEASLAEKDATIATALKETRERLTRDFHEVLVEKEGELLESTATTSILRENQTKILADLSKFQILLEEAREEDESVSTSSETGRIDNKAHCGEARHISTQTDAVEDERSSLTRSLGEARETLAASALDTMKQSGQSSEFIGIFLEKEQELVQTQMKLTEATTKTNELEDRFEQLQYFLQDSLQQNERDGDDARAVQSELAESTIRCQALEAQLIKYQEDMEHLQHSEAKLTDMLSTLRKQQREAEMRADVQAKAMASLQTQLTAELDDHNSILDKTLAAQLTSFQDSEMELKDMVSTLHQKHLESQVQSKVQAKVIETLQSQLSTELDQHEALKVQLSEYQEDSTSLQDFKRKLAQQQHEATVRSEAQIKVIERLRTQLSTELDDFKAKQEFEVEEIEQHVMNLEQEIVKSVHANEHLECTLLETEMALKASQEVVADLKAASNTSDEQSKKLRIELNRANCARDEIEMKLLEVQSSLEATILDQEFLRTKTQDAEQVFRLQLVRQAESESAMSNRVKVLQEQLDSIVREKNEILLASTQDSTVKDTKYQTLKSALAGSLNEIECQREALHNTAQESQVQASQHLELSTRLIEMEFQLDEVSRERSELQLSYEKEIARREGLQKSLKEMQLSLDEKDELNSAARSEVRQLKENLYQQAEAGSSTSKEIDELNKQLVISAQHTIELQASLESTHTESTERQRSLTSLQHQLDERRTLVNEELEVILCERTQLQRELEREKDQNDEQNDFLCTLRSQLEEKDTRIEELDVELNAILNERVALELMFGQECSKSTRLEAQLRFKTDELETAQRESEIERVDMQEVVDSLETECTTHRAAVDDQLKQIERLHAALRKGGKEAEILADEVIRFDDELEAAECTIKDQDEASTFLQKRVLELEKLYNSTKAEIEKLSQEDSSITSANPAPFTPIAKGDLAERTKRLTLKASELSSQKKASRLVASSEKQSPAVGGMEKSLRLSAAALLIENVLYHRETAALGRAFRQWSTTTSTLRAVSQHVHVAEVMNRQLQATREKLAKLKSHLKSEQKKRGERILAKEFRGWSPN